MLLNDPNRLIDLERFLVFRGVKPTDIASAKKRVAARLSQKLNSNAVYDDKTFGRLSFSVIDEEVRALESSYPGLSLAYQKDRMMPGRRDTASSNPAKHGPSPTAINVPGMRGSSYGSGKGGDVWGHFYDEAFDTNIAQLGKALGFNKGGKVPGYAVGGKVLRYQTGGGPVPELKFAGPELIAAAQRVGLIPTEPQAPSRGRMMGAGIARMGIGTAGFMLGSQLTGGSMFGGMLGGILGDIGGTAAYNGIVNYNKAVLEAEKRTSLFKKAVSGFRSLPGPFQAVSAVITLGLVIKGVNDKINEHRRIIDQGFAPTEDVAKKLNLQFESTVSVLNRVQEQMTALRESGQAFAMTTTGIGIPGVSLSIEEFDQLSEKVKSDFPDLIEVFNKAKADEVVTKAEQLKAQFIAGGMSAQDATNFIYTLIKASNDAVLALSAIGSEGFKSITDSATAANSAVKTFLNLLSENNTDQIPEAFQTASVAIDKMRKDLVGTKNESGNLIGETEALQIALQKIGEVSGSNNKLSANQLNQLANQHELLKDILGTNETIESIYAKIKLLTMGVSIDLKNIGSDSAGIVLQTFTAMEEQLRSTEGPLKGLALQIKNLQSGSDASKIIKAAQKTQDQIKKEIDLREKNIAKIKEEADARLEALDREREDEDALLQIRKLQLQYQNQVAAGNLEAAAQTAIDIQRTVGDRQSDLARRAIEDKANERIKAEESAIERLQNQLDRTQKRVDSANKTAQETSDRLEKAQSAMSQAVSAAMMADNGLTQDEIKAINRISSDLSKGGFEDIASLISTVVPENLNPTRADAQARGLVKTPVEKLFEDTFAQITVENGSLKTILADVSINKLRDLIKGSEVGTSAKRPITFTREDLMKSRIGDVTNVSAQSISSLIANQGLASGQFFKVGNTTYKVDVGVNDKNPFKIATPVKRKSGGFVRSGQFAIVGEDGPELVLSKTDSMVLSNRNSKKLINDIYSKEINSISRNGSLRGITDSVNNGTMGTTIMVDKVVMKFPETPENGKQMFAEFKEAMRVENLKKGGTVRI